MIHPFKFARIPKIVFGAGKFSEVPGIIGRIGRSALLVTGARSQKTSDTWRALVVSRKGPRMRRGRLQAGEIAIDNSPVGRV
jgi:hypothetical protein